MYLIVLSQIPRRDAQKVIGSARHKVALKDLVKIADRPLEPIHRFTALAGQRNFNEHLHCQTQPRRFQPGAIPRDDPSLLERLYPSMAGRR